MFPFADETGPDKQAFSVLGKQTVAVTSTFTKKKKKRKKKKSIS